MNASGKHDGGYHKVAPDPEETPDSKETEQDDEQEQVDGDHAATGPAQRAGIESKESEQSPRR